MVGSVALSAGVKTMYSQITSLKTIIGNNTEFIVTRRFIPKAFDCIIEDEDIEMVEQVANEFKLLIENISVAIFISEYIS